MTLPAPYWIPNVNAAELPGTRNIHMEMSNQETAVVELLIPETQIGLARYWGLRNGGYSHPQNSSLHISSIDASYDYPSETAANVGYNYPDQCIRLTLQYKEWQLPNQGYDSTLENISQTYTLPLRGVYWGTLGNPGVPSNQQVWGSEIFINRGNLRITRTYTGRSRSPLYINAYNNTVNANALTILEWGITIAPQVGLFRVGNFQRQHTRDWSNPDPAAMVDIYSYSYSMELMEGTWNTLHHPQYGVLLPFYTSTGQQVSMYQMAAWDLTSLIE